MPMRKISTIFHTKKESGKCQSSKFDYENSLLNEMSEKISVYLDYIEKNGEQVNKETINRLLNFSKSYRVLKSENVQHVEMNLN